MSNLVLVTYNKTTMCGSIKSTVKVEEYVKLDSLGIVDGKLVRGFGYTATGGVIFGRAILLSDVISVDVK